MKNPGVKGFRYKDLSNNCIVIVIVYAKCVNRRITNKAIVIVTSSCE